MSLDINVLFIVGLTIGYLTKVMLFKASGPWQDPSKFVVDNGTHLGAVDLFDRVRRLFGVYRVEDSTDGVQVWRTYEPRLAVWTCPYCLSWWMAFVGSVPFCIILLVETGPSVLWLSPFIHGAITAISVTTNWLWAYLDGETRSDGLREENEERPGGRTGKPTGVQVHGAVLQLHGSNGRSQIGNGVPTE